jgi:hypothetical protein
MEGGVSSQHISTCAVGTSKQTTVNVSSTSPQNAQIVHAFETLGLGIGEICTLLGHESEAVKLVLATHSKVYRDMHKPSSENVLPANELFTADDAKAAAGIISNLLYADSESVRLRAARYVVDEHKGRHDVDKFKGLNINVAFFNERLKKAREAKAIALGHALSSDESNATNPGPGSTIDV